MAVGVSATVELGLADGDSCEKPAPQPKILLAQEGCYGFPPIPVVIGVATPPARAT